MIHNNKIFYLVALILACALTTACENWLPNAHRPDFTQGNEIKREALEQIKVGMKKIEITSIIGSPMLQDPFHPNRWDYVYRYLPRGRTEAKGIESRVTLFFEDNILVNIDTSLYVEPKSDNEEREEEREKEKSPSRLIEPID